MDVLPDPVPRRGQPKPAQRVQIVPPKPAAFQERPSTAVERMMQESRQQRVATLYDELRRNQQKPLLPQPLPAGPVPVDALMTNTQTYFHDRLKRQWDQTPYPDAFRRAIRVDRSQRAQYKYGH